MVVKRHHIAPSAAAVVLLSFALPAQAQVTTTSPAAATPQGPGDIPGDIQGPGDIIVTANKREQNIQKVGIAITALGQTALSALGRQEITAVSRQVPGLQVQQFAPTVTVFNIRGVSQNDLTDSEEAPIAFYNDGVYISALGAISGMNFDLDRVEVLRGPQGTLFGRNATGGLVQVITAKPTGTLEGFVTGTVSSYGQYSTEAALSGPLTDTLQGRVSFTSTDGGDYITNRTGPNLGGQKFYAGRLQLAGQVGGNGKFTLKLEGLGDAHDRDAGLYSWAPAVPNALGLGTIVPANVDAYGFGPGTDANGYKEPDHNPYTVAFDHTPYFTRIFFGGTLTYVQDLGGLTLTSISNYQHLTKKYADDEDMSPLPIFAYDTNVHLYQISQELRLSHDTGRFKWIAGLYGMRIHNKDLYSADLSQSFVGIAENYGNVLKTNSLAGFGQAEYQLTDALALTGGIRYSKDWKTFDFQHSSNGVTDFLFNPATVGNLAHNNAGNYSGKVEINYTPSSHALFYATVSRGTKSGGFNTFALPTEADGTFDPNKVPFKQEVLTDFEGGVKLTMFGGSTHFNIAGYYYQYNNYQSYESVGISLIVRNQNARLKGLEFDFNTTPIHGLYLSSFLTLEHSRVFNITTPSGAVVDRMMPQAPSFTVGGLVRYEHDLGPGKAALQTNWKYNSYQYFTAFNAPVDREPAYAVGDVRLSYVPDSRPLEFAFFVNNVGNKLYRLYSYDFSTVFGNAQSVYARPRWFGGSITYKIK